MLFTYLFELRIYWLGLDSIFPVRRRETGLLETLSLILQYFLLLLSKRSDVGVAIAN